MKDRKYAMSEEAFEAWLDEGTYADWLYLARACRRRIGLAIQEADSHGDGPLVNALCAEARKIFSPSLIW